MGLEKELIITDIVSSIRRLYRAVYLDSSKTSRQYGLTSTQSMVLRVLLSNGPLSSADLSRKIYVTPSNMTGVIDRLQQRGLVERTRRVRDRRVVSITLTEQGRTLSALLPDPIEKKLIQGLAHMELGKIETLADDMNRILNLIDAGGGEPVPLDDLGRVPVMDSGSEKADPRES